MLNEMLACTAGDRSPPAEFTLPGTPRLFSPRHRPSWEAGLLDVMDTTHLQQGTTDSNCGVADSVDVSRKPIRLSKPMDPLCDPDVFSTWGWGVQL